MSVHFDLLSDKLDWQARTIQTQQSCFVNNTHEDYLQGQFFNSQLS